MRALIFIALVGCSATTPPSAAPPPATTAAPDAAPQAALIGVTPPEWQLEGWMGSEPRTVASLRGSVVLVRWWTAGCPYCSSTAPALRHFDRTYGPRGLQVIGIYHHKGDAPFEPAVYEDTAKKYGFTFPVAVDPEWKNFESWMRDRDGNKVDTGWTSVTFLLDRRGVIRHVHPGGQYVEGEPAYAEMQAAIERLLTDG